METKVKYDHCKICGTLFEKRNNSHFYCKDCSDERVRECRNEYYLKNAEKIKERKREYTREYYLKNREREIEKTRKYLLKNPE